MFIRKGVRVFVCFISGAGVLFVFGEPSLDLPGVF